MYNLRSTLRTITKAPKLGVFTAIGAVIVLTMLLAACPEEAPSGPTAPSSPTNLGVEISDGQAELTWGAVAGATEYRIYRVGSDGTLTRIAEDTTITETTFTVTGLDNGTLYRYVIRAVNSAGIESGDSSQIRATPEFTIPPIPKNLSANPADTQVTLSWAASNSAAEYRIYRASTPDGTLVRIAEGTTITETSYIDTDVTNNTQYRYTVRAFNIRGESKDSNEVTATPVPATVVPPAPANLSATAGDAEISLSWDPVPGATEYRVSRADTSTDPLVRIAENDTITVASYTDTGLTNGTTYRYTVRAVNGIGDGPDSSEATATPVLAAPVAPTNLNAAATASGQVTLTWNAVGNAETYQVFRADTADGDLTRIDDSTPTPVTDATYTDTGLANDTAYRYTVRAVNAAGISPASSEASVTTLALPAAPANLSATASVVGSDLRVTLTWEAVTGATAYQIYRADTAEGTLERVTTDADITGTTYTDTGLTHTTTYRYTVRAVDSVGVGASSAEASATTRGLPAAPANLSATASGAANVFQVSLAWDAVIGATEYRIYRADTADGARTRVTMDSAITGTTYIDTGLTHNTAYRYTVRAVDVIGESVDSTEARATTPALPAVPANLSATTSVVAGNARISLSWDAVTGATEYQVYRAATANGALTRIASSTTITEAAYADTSVTSGTTYRYAVRAVNSAGTSADSSEASATAPTPLAAPESPSAITGALAVLLSWDAVTSATEYRIYRANTANGTLVRVADNVVITATSYTDSGLTNGTTYRYAVRAVNSTGDSANSSVVSATPDDHGNTPAGATPVTSGTAVNGNIAVAGDFDFFSIAVTGASSSAPVTINATAPGDVNSDGTLFNSSGTEIGRDAASGTNNDFRIIRSVTVDGTYYIRVDGRSSSRGTYTLTITAAATAIDTDDHRNIRSGATAVTSGTAESGTLNANGDFDYFSIAVTGASSSSSVSLTAETTGSTDVVGILFDSNGTELATNDDIALRNSNFRIVHSITENGTYYIRVHGYKYERTGDYSLTVTTQ